MAFNLGLLKRSREPISSRFLTNLMILFKRISSEGFFLFIFAPAFAPFAKNWRAFYARELRLFFARENF